MVELVKEGEERIKVRIEKEKDKELRRDEVIRSEEIKIGDEMGMDCDEWGIEKERMLKRKRERSEGEREELERKIDEGMEEKFKERDKV